MVAQLQTPTLSLTRPNSYTVEGLVQVFTSSGRGFFTNVIAQALQIAAQGRPVLVVQFLKGGINQGQQHPIKLVQHLHWVRCNLRSFVDNSELEESDKNTLLDLWQYTQKAILSGHYSLVVLDELSLAIKFGFIPEQEVLNLLQKRPHHVDIILTGPEMPITFLEFADQVTEIRRSYIP